VSEREGEIRKASPSSPEEGERRKRGKAVSLEKDDPPSPLASRGEKRGEGKRETEKLLLF